MCTFIIIRLGLQNRLHIYKLLHDVLEMIVTIKSQNKQQCFVSGLSFVFGVFVCLFTHLFCLFCLGVFKCYFLNFGSVSDRIFIWRIGTGVSFIISKLYFVLKM